MVMEKIFPKCRPLLFANQLQCLLLLFFLSIAPKGISCHPGVSCIFIFLEKWGTDARGKLHETHGQGHHHLAMVVVEMVTFLSEQLEGMNKE